MSFSSPGARGSFSFLRFGAAGLLMALLFAVQPSTLKAQTVLSTTFSSTPPGYDPGTGDSWSVGGPGQTSLAVGFQDPSSTSSYQLTQIQVADNFFAADPNDVTDPSLDDLIVSIAVSATNDPNSATVLGSWNVAPGPLQTAEIFTVTPTSTVDIDPNEYYFITESVMPDGADTADWGWQENTLTPMQIGYWAGSNGVPPGSFTYADTPCTVDPCTAVNDPDASGTPAYSVTGSVIAPAPTPEPSSLVLLGSGVLAVAGMARRRWAAQV